MRLRHRTDALPTVSHRASLRQYAVAGTASGSRTRVRRRRLRTPSSALGPPVGHTSVPLTTRQLETLLATTPEGSGEWLEPARRAAASRRFRRMRCGLRRRLTDA